VQGRHKLFTQTGKSMYGRCPGISRFYIDSDGIKSLGYKSKNRSKAYPDDHSQYYKSCRNGKEKRFVIKTPGKQVAVIFNNQLKGAQDNSNQQCYEEEVDEKRDRRA